MIRKCVLQSKVAPVQACVFAAEYLDGAVKLRMLQAKRTRIRFALFFARIEGIFKAIRRALA